MFTQRNHTAHQTHDGSTDEPDKDPQEKQTKGKHNNGKAENDQQIGEHGKSAERGGQDHHTGNNGSGGKGQEQDCGHKQHNNTDKGESYVEDNFDKSIVELKWHLIREKLVEAQNIKVEDKDIKAAAIQATRYQFAQYGLNNIPDEYLENYAQEMLKKREQVSALVERCIDQKLTAAYKQLVNLNHKSISAEDFSKMF